MLRKSLFIKEDYIKGAKLNNNKNTALYCRLSKDDGTNNESRFKTDSAYSNYNLDRFYDETDRLQIAANDRNIAENLPSEYITPEKKVKSDFAKGQKAISGLSREEKRILEAAMPMSEKNRQIMELKKQKNEIAKNMLESKDSLYEAYKEKYLPGVNVMPEYKALDKITKQATQKCEGISHTMTAADKQKYQRKYSEILDREISELVDSGYYGSLNAEEQAKKAVVSSYGVSDSYNMKHIGIKDYKKLLDKRREKRGRIKGLLLAEKAESN